ncbi:MAG: hypothetical protein Q4E65_07700 [Clostridia bacterium]|nr:hypothetical protein [Clostridia bacterium]
MSTKNTQTPEEQYHAMVAALRAARPEKETVKLFKDNGRYKGDMLVSVNGRRFLLQRGMEVEVPYAIARVIERSARQDEQAAMLVSRLANEARFA